MSLLQLGALGVTGLPEKLQFGLVANKFFRDILEFLVSLRVRAFLFGDLRFALDSSRDSNGLTILGFRDFVVASSSSSRMLASCTG